MSHHFQERLQELLAETVKADEDSIVLRELLRRMRPQVLRSANDVASPFRRAFRLALSEEIFFGRVALDGLVIPPRLRITAVGLPFYATLSLPARSQRRKAPRIRKPDGPLRQAAIDKYLPIADILKAIKEMLEARNIGVVDIATVEQLPQTVRSLLESEQDLRGENSTLDARLNDLRYEISTLQVRVQEEAGGVLSEEDEGDVSL
ncbi:hypothetical protein OH77DRAFT_1429140 [Trametes cingulata]|nr:hypothetical protein OH77DRAFT_1429140 [Trametes cingulata]